MFAFLPGLTPTTLAAKVLAAVLIAGALMGAGAYGGYRWELGRYNALVAANAASAAQAARLAAKDQAARDKITLDAALRDAVAQPQIVDHYHTITKEITVHVSDRVPCISYGLVRVLNAAAGSAAYAVPDAAGEPDDACAPVTWRAFAAAIVADYQAAAQNGQQLTDLQDWIKAQESAH